MIPLNSPEWSRLKDAYGSADKIPGRLQAIADGPGDEVAWEELWSCLCHQGDVYTASVAAVPHVIHAGLKCTPERFRADYILLPVAIEKARMRRPWQLRPTEIPDDYWSAVLLLESLCAIASEAGHDNAVREAGRLLRGRNGSRPLPQEAGGELGELFGPNRPDAG
ncbi:MAG: hypothetical protein B9S38_09660 [Verrucomicrobiia bacterium Tous-C4TDCM]|nr:MAG: hypothetical protein B9S38_09660 [Verrucomicrobiae bacterium Tous-C4TDCM]